MQLFLIGFECPTEEQLEMVLDASPHVPVAVQEANATRAQIMKAKAVARQQLLEERAQAAIKKKPKKLLDIPAGVKLAITARASDF